MISLLIGISIVTFATVSAEESKLSTKTTKTTNITPQLTRLAAANWAQGTAYDVEYPSIIYRTDRKAWGTTYWGKNNTLNYFHISIPSTLISDGRWNSLVLRYLSHSGQMEMR
jgi:hypothetical protein